MLSRLCQFALLLLLIIRATAYGQTTRLGESCDLSIVGATDSVAFLSFDRELRAALTHQTPVELSFVVDFPLKVNSDRGEITLDNPAALQSHFQEILPAQARAAIVSKPITDLFCTADGVMYGDGELWIEFTSRGYGLKVINLSAASTGKNDRHWPGKIEFLCRTEKYRIAIDSDSQQTSRYRSWNRPHFVDGKPDMELKAGTLQYEGTGSCAYPTWTFKNGDTTYSVEGLGCTSQADPPPAGATGSFAVTNGSRPLAHGWCY